MGSVIRSLDTLVRLRDQGLESSKSQKHWVERVKQEVPSEVPGFMGPHVEIVDDNRFAEVAATQGYKILSPKEAVSMMRKQFERYDLKEASEKSAR